MITSERERIASNELSSGETLLWTGAPDPSRMARPTWGLCMFGVLWTAFTIFFWVLSNGSPASQSSGVASGWTWNAFSSQLFPLVFVIIGLFMTLSPAITYWMALKTVYAVTNQRLLIIEQGTKRSTRSFDRSAINVLECVERLDGSGDVTFSQSTYRDGDGDQQIRKEQFIGIPDACGVERLIRETLQPEFKTDDGMVSLRPPDLTPEGYLEARERIERRFILTEEGNTLTIVRRRQEDWRMRRSGIAGSLGCSAFLSIFVVGMAMSGVVGYPFVDPLLGYFQFLWDILALVVICSVWWSLITFLFGIWGAEEWVISENRFTVRARMFGIRWEKRWSDCGIKIARATHGEKIKNSLYVWDFAYIFRLRAMILPDDRIEDIQMLAEILTRYSGWPLLLEGR